MPTSMQWKCPCHVPQGQHMFGSQTQKREWRGEVQVSVPHFREHQSIPAKTHKEGHALLCMARRSPARARLATRAKGFSRQDAANAQIQFLKKYLVLFFLCACLLHGYPGETDAINNLSMPEVTPYVPRRVTYFCCRQASRGKFCHAKTSGVF